MLQFLILLAAMSATPALAQVRAVDPNLANMVAAAMKPMGSKPFRMNENGWKIPPDAGAAGSGRALPQPFAAWDARFFYGRFLDKSDIDFQLFIYSPMFLDARTAFAMAAAARTAHFDSSIPVEQTTITLRHGQMAADIRTRTTEFGEETSLLLFAHSSDRWLVKLIVYRPGSRDAVLAEAIALLDRIELPTGVKWEAASRAPRTPCTPIEKEGNLTPAPPMTEEDRSDDTILTLGIVGTVAGASLDIDWCALGLTSSGGLPVQMLRRESNNKVTHFWDAAIGDGGLTVGLRPVVPGGTPEKPVPRWTFDIRQPAGIFLLARLEGEADDADFRALVDRLDELLWNRKDPPLIQVGRPMPKR